MCYLFYLLFSVVAYYWNSEKMMFVASEHGSDALQADNAAKVREWIIIP